MRRHIQQSLRTLLRMRPNVLFACILCILGTAMTTCFAGNSPLKQHETSVSPNSSSQLQLKATYEASLVTASDKSVRERLGPNSDFTWSTAAGGRKMGNKKVDAGLSGKTFFLPDREDVRGDGDQLNDYKNLPKSSKQSNSMGVKSPQQDIKIDKIRSRDKKFNSFHRKRNQAFLNQNLNSLKEVQANTCTLLSMVRILRSLPSLGSLFEVQNFFENHPQTTDQLLYDICVRSSIVLSNALLEKKSSVNHSVNESTTKFFKELLSYMQTRSSCCDRHLLYDHKVAKEHLSVDDAARSNVDLHMPALNSLRNFISSMPHLETMLFCISNEGMLAGDRSKLSKCIGASKSATIGADQEGTRRSRKKRFLPLVDDITPYGFSSIERDGYSEETEVFVIEEEDDKELSVLYPLKLALAIFTYLFIGVLSYFVFLIPITGPKGPKGQKGWKGWKGYRGLRGEPGDNGLKGDEGFKGFMGPEGWSGLQGIKGNPGHKGDKGDIGEKGSKGKKGKKGHKGKPGAVTPGDIGSKGFKGAIGPIGFIGHHIHIPGHKHKSASIQHHHSIGLGLGILGRQMNIFRKDRNSQELADIEVVKQDNFDDPITIQYGSVKSLPIQDGVDEKIALNSYDRLKEPFDSPKAGVTHYHIMDAIMHEGLDANKTKNLKLNDKKNSNDENLEALKFKKELGRVIEGNTEAEVTSISRENSSTAIVSTSFSHEVAAAHSKAYMSSSDIGSLVKLVARNSVSGENSSVLRRVKRQLYNIAGPTSERVYQHTAKIKGDNALLQPSSGKPTQQNHDFYRNKFECNCNEVLGKITFGLRQSIQGERNTGRDEGRFSDHGISSTKAHQPKINSNGRIPRRHSRSVKGEEVASFPTEGTKFNTLKEQKRRKIDIFEDVVAVLRNANDLWRPCNWSCIKGYIFEFLEEQPQLNLDWLIVAGFAHVLGDSGSLQLLDHVRRAGWKAPL